MADSETRFDAGKARLLLVDDEPEIRAFLTLLFEEQGFQVVSAQSGDEAWELYLSYSFSLVLTDWQMPNGSGLELARRIRAFEEARNKARLPIALITGSNPHSEETQALALNIDLDHVFKKPFHPKQLISDICGLMGKPSL